MAKICIYCGKEIVDGEKCTCRVGADNFKSTENNKSQKKDKKKQEQEQNRKEKERQRFTKAKNASQKTSSKQGFKVFFIKLLTSKGFNRQDPLPTKFGISFLQSFLRPVTASEAFIRNNDLYLSIAYVILFSLSFSIGIMRLVGFGIASFIEGLFLGAIAILLLNLFTMLVFRFVAKVRISFMNFLSAYSLPSIFISIFILIASIGRPSVISFFTTIVSGLLASVLMHFISLKVLTGQPTERLLIVTILVYFLFLMFLSVIATLMTPAQQIAPALTEIRLMFEMI